MNKEARNTIIDLSKNLQSTSLLKSKSKVDKEVKNLSKEAYDYLAVRTWCKRIEEGWLAEEWGYMFCVFLFKIIPSAKEVDDYVWIVVGDIPPCYIDIESAQDVKEVVESYILIMRDWTHAVLNNLPLDQSFPVAVEPSEKLANMLNDRLDIIESNILPFSGEE